MMIVWRMRVKIIGTILCCVVYTMMCTYMLGLGLVFCVFV